MSTLDTTQVTKIAQVTRPSVLGVAFRVYLLGGSSLTDKQAASGGGSPHLYRTHTKEIREIVKQLEASTQQGA